MWDLDRAEVVTWVSDDPSFAQAFAIEASGLAASGRYLFVPSEKYARLLVVDTGVDVAVRVIPLAVPRHAELEGVALGDGSLFFCDEAHAAVYSADIETDGLLGSDLDDLPLPVREVLLEGIAVRGGKIGFEGIEVSSDGRSLYLLLERSGDETKGCVSRIFRLRVETGRLVVEAEPLEIPLEDCAWRLTGLAWWRGRLLALKTQYPGERYEVVMIDLVSGNCRVVLEMTELLRSLEREGWSNNVEGIAVASDGALWLVADNAVTGVIDDPLPKPTDSRTLLLRIPAQE